MSEDIERRARELWEQRERLMLEYLAIPDFQPVLWEDAPEQGRNLLRRAARYYYEHDLLIPVG